MLNLYGILMFALTDTFHRFPLFLFIECVDSMYICTCMYVMFVYVCNFYTGVQNGLIALHMAVVRGSIPLIKPLLKRGASIDAENEVA